MANYRKIKVEDLKLDTENPRLPKSLSQTSEEKIIEYMLLDASTLELMQAIGENGFFEGEQILVVKPDSDGKYLVVEGNRRLTSVKLLLDYELATVQTTKVKKVYDAAENRPTEIPCLVFEEKQEISKYLGYRHTTGVKPWKVLEKAKFLSQLKESSFKEKIFDTACKELAKTIGSRKDYVKRLLVGYEIYTIIEDNGFYKIRDLDDRNFYFGYLLDSLRYTNIEEFLGVNLSLDNPLDNLNEPNVKKWTHWFFKEYDQGKTRVKGKSGDLVDLNNVLGHEEAKKAFDDNEESLKKALELTKDTDTIFKNCIKKSYGSLEQANSLAHKVKDFGPILENLEGISTLTRVIKSIKKELKENDDI